MPSRIVFMGSPDFAVPALAALIDDMADVEVVGVVSQPDRPAGRGRKLRPPPVKAFAEDRGLLVLQPRKVRDGALQRWLAELHADVAIVAAYGRILPQAVLDTPRLGCLNLHASLLPRWRGASPIQRAIAAGDPQSGVCLMQMDAGLDTGDVLARIETPIGPDDTAETLSDRLSTDGAALLLRALPTLFSGELAAVAQSTIGVTHAALLTKDEGRVRWQRTAQQVHAQIRAMTSWPGAWTTVVTDPNMDNSAQLRGESFSKRAEPACGGKAQLAGLGRAPRAPKNEKETAPNARRTCSHLVQSPTVQNAPRETWKVFPPAMQIVAGADALPGTVLAIKGERVTIACGEGALTLHELQRPGRKRMGAGSAVRGARFTVGARFATPVEELKG